MERTFKLYRKQLNSLNNYDYGTIIYYRKKLLYYSKVQLTIVNHRSQYFYSDLFLSHNVCPQFIRGVERYGRRQKKAVIVYWDHEECGKVHGL